MTDDIKKELKALLEYLTSSHSRALKDPTTDSSLLRDLATAREKIYKIIKPFINTTKKKDEPKPMTKSEPIPAYTSIPVDVKAFQRELRVYRSGYPTNSPGYSLLNIIAEAAAHLDRTTHAPVIASDNENVKPIDESQRNNYRYNENSPSTTIHCPNMLPMSEAPKGPIILIRIHAHHRMDGIIPCFIAGAWDQWTKRWRTIDGQEIIYPEGFVHAQKVYYINPPNVTS
jgi:hypothetical protein